MAANKEKSSYQIIGLVTASVFLMLFAFTMYKLNRASATPYKTQLKNGYATMDDDYLDSPSTTSPLDTLISKRKGGSPPDPITQKKSQRFEFYSVLPDFQVDASVSKDAATQNNNQTLNTATSTRAEQLGGQVIRVPANAHPAIQENSNRAGEFLQAGSFMDISDARRRRAEVIMLGLNAKVESAQVQGRIYHRVKLGPYGDQNQRQTARQRLAAAGIEVIVKSH